MKQLSSEEWNEIQARTRRWNREHGVTPQMQARIDAATSGLMQFGRKAPTAAELRAQWLEQQRHEAEIRQRFTTAERI